VDELLHEEVTHEIIGAFFEVYNALPMLQRETVYSAAMVIALAERKLSVRREVTYPLYFRRELVGQVRVDLIVDEKVVVELKSAVRIVGAHELQLLRYLRVTRMQVGLLLNFGLTPEKRRLICTPEGLRLHDQF
jgi:GxxExxY protein